MKINAIIKGENVTITLTEKQLKEITKQINKFTVNDINDIQDAERILENCVNHTKYVEAQFVRKKDWIAYQLETVIKASNFIDNNYQEWKPNFNNFNESIDIFLFLQS